MGTTGGFMATPSCHRLGAGSSQRIGEREIARESIRDEVCQARPDDGRSIPGPPPARPDPARGDECARSGSFSRSASRSRIGGGGDERSSADRDGDIGRALRFRGLPKSLAVVHRRGRPLGGTFEELANLGLLTRERDAGSRCHLTDAGRSWILDGRGLVVVFCPKCSTDEHVLKGRSQVEAQCDVCGVGWTEDTTAEPIARSTEGRRRCRRRWPCTPPPSEGVPLRKFAATRAIAQQCFTTPKSSAPTTRMKMTARHPKQLRAFAAGSRNFPVAPWVV